MVGYFGTMLANGAYFGMGAVYGHEIGLSVRDISLFVSLILIGGMVLQWPIGRLSDAWDRRLVLTGVTFLAALFALLAGFVAERSLACSRWRRCSAVPTCRSISSASPTPTTIWNAIRWSRRAARWC